MSFKTIIPILSFFLLLGCGYEAVYSKKNMQRDYFFSINEVEFVKNTRLNRQIQSKLKPYMNLENKTKNLKLKIQSSKNRVIESKNRKGEAEKFKVEIIVNLSVSENENYNKGVSIKESFIYDNLTDSFDLTEYEAQINDNLIAKITDNIVLYLFSIR